MSARSVRLPGGEEGLYESLLSEQLSQALRQRGPGRIQRLDAVAPV
jgi:hypothetical protein